MATEAGANAEAPTTAAMVMIVRNILVDSLESRMNNETCQQTIATNCSGVRLLSFRNRRNLKFEDPIH